MSRKRGLALLVAAVVTALVLWLLVPRATEQDAPLPATSDRTVRSPLPFARHPPAPPVREVPPPPAKLPAVQEAMQALARAKGTMAMVCPIPADADLHTPIDGRVFDGAWQVMVEDPAGVQLLFPRDADEPLGVLSWSMGKDGQLDCRFDAPSEVSIRGDIDPADGPLPERVTCGDRSALVEVDGSFELSIRRGSACELSARADGHRGRAHVNHLDPEPRVSISMEPVDGDAVEDLADGLFDAVDDVEALQLGPDPYTLAMEEPDLSAEARRLLEGWREQDALQRGLLQDQLEDVLLDVEHLLEATR